MPDPSPATLQFALDNLLLLISGALVFWMHAGFAMLEAGMTRSKNTINILAKNVVVVALSGIAYYIVGYKLMYPGSFGIIPGVLGFGGAPINLDSPPGPHATAFTDFFFQAVFAATSATIISGAVAERVKYHAFIIVAFFFVTLVYPVAGSWKWGGGFLESFGFYDFAGSTLVHSVGGWAALTGAIILGPRRGKFVDGHVRPILAHSIPLATLGVLILFLGWFGFNGGSVLQMDPARVSLVYVTTFLAGCAGGIGALAVSWAVLRKPDITMILNGFLAGLVGITAGADVISPLNSILVGAIAGAIVFGAVILLDRLRIDDPVGAVPVHLFCGVWGTLAVGIFSANPNHTLIRQLAGIAVIGAYTLAVSAAIWFALKHSPIGLRVGAEEETNGLDGIEHAMEAYPEFKSTTGVM